MVAAPSQPFQERVPISDFTTGGMIKWHLDAYKIIDLPSSKPTSEPTYPQGSAREGCLVDAPSNWKPADFSGPEAFTYCLTNSDIAELEAVLNDLDARGITHLAGMVDKGHFQLPTLGPKLLTIKNEVVHGRGFQLLRGLPTKRWGIARSSMAYWVLGVWLGVPKPQNRTGRLINHIKDMQDKGSLFKMPHRANFAQPWHVDGIRGIVGLLCIGQAPIGGVSRWASSTTIYNEFIKRGRRDLLDELLRDQWWLPRKGFFQNGAPFIDNGVCNYERMRIFSCHEGHIQGHYTGPWYAGVTKDKVSPSFTQKQWEALLMLDALAYDESIHLQYTLQPGDIQLLNNAVCFHNRDPFEDGETEETTRHLVRLHLLPDTMPQAYLYVQRSSDGLNPIDGTYLVPDGVELSTPLEPGDNT